MNASPGPLCLAVCLSAASAVAAHAQENWLEMNSELIDSWYTINGQDLAYWDSSLYLLRPRENGISRFMWDDQGQNMTASSYSACPEDVISDEPCWLNDCLNFACAYCESYDNDFEPIYSSVIRHLMDDVAIDAWPGGDLVLTPKSGPLGLYGSGGGFVLWTGCTFNDGSVGKEDNTVGIFTYDVAPGSDMDFFSLSYGNGPGLTNGMVVGTVDPSSGMVQSRRGSGTGQGGTGGGGPYPGVDSNWSIIENIGNLSIGRDNAVGDFNLDGWDDLVVLHPYEDTFSILPFLELSDYVSQNTGDLIPGGAVFGEPISPNTSIDAPVFAESGDFNGDGLDDLVICGRAGDHHFYKGTETGELEEWATLSSPAGKPVSMTTTDLDADGRDEVIEIGAEGSHDSPVWIQVFRVNPLGEILVEHDNIFRASGTPYTIEASSLNGQCAVLATRHGHESVIHGWGLYDPHSEDIPFKCGDAESGNCLIPKETPGCWDPECCSAVCAVDSFCCDVAWDQTCANAAQACEEILLDCGETAAGSCQQQNGTPFCDNAKCCETVCMVHPLCCEVEWDETCVQFAGAFSWACEEYPEGEEETLENPWDVPSSLASADPSVISCGNEHVLLLEDGRISSFGSNENSQLDIPRIPDRDLQRIEHCGTWQEFVNRPLLAIDTEGRLVSSLSIPEEVVDVEVRDLSSGGNFRIVLDTDGFVYAWGGTNPHGELDVPEAVQGNTIWIAAGWNHALAQLEDGSIVAWGNNDHGQCDVPSDVKFLPSGVFAGNNVSFAIDENNQPIAWGDMIDQISEIPADLVGPFVEIRIGEDHCTALLDSPDAMAFEVKCWGNNDHNQCNVPDELQGRVVRTSVGRDHTLLLLDDGNVEYLGDHYGHSWMPSKLVSPINPIIEIATYDIGNILVFADGRITGWPYSRGRTPAEPIRDVAAVDDYSVIIDANGRISVIGDTRNGHTFTMPAEVVGEAVDVSCSLDRVSVLMENGEVHTWGRGSHDQPAGLNNVVSIETFGQGTLALQESGNLVAWGSSSPGSIPESIQGRIVEYGANENRGYALLNDGTITSWRNGVESPWLAPTVMGDIAEITGQYILETDGTLHNLGLPCSPAAIPANCSAIDFGADFVVAKGHPATSEVHIVSLDIDPLSSAAADFNNDGMVDGFDLGQLLADWGNPGGPADINQDGIVDGIDLGMLLSAWGPVQ
ncbi:MAG: FG-GAP-like repeat-containing protein [Phycisphaerales bacterium]|nr:FG-GAP-like repeat-containing protein [Phycisphaerales bacterium]